MTASKPHLRFTPKSGHSEVRLQCPLCANSGHAFHSSRTKVEVPSVLLLTISSFGLNASIVLVVDLFKTRSSSALVMLNVIDLPLIAQVPPIVPVTPLPSVLLMNSAVATGI